MELSESIDYSCFKDGIFAQPLLNLDEAAEKYDSIRSLKEFIDNLNLDTQDSLENSQPAPVVEEEVKKKRRRGGKKNKNK